MKRTIIIFFVSVMALFSTPALGEEPPSFYENTFPEHALKEKLTAEKVLVGKDAQLDAKTRCLTCYPRVFSHDCPLRSDSLLRPFTARASL